MQRDEILLSLREVPALAAEVLRGLADDEVRRRPEPGQLSILEILCHLRDSAIEEGLRARRMVEEENPRLEPYDPLTRARERGYQDEKPAKVMTALRAYYTGYAYQLERFSDAEWERPGVHPEMGPVTVRSRAELEVQHAQTHFTQIRATRRLVAGR